MYLTGAVYKPRRQNPRDKPTLRRFKTLRPDINTHVTTINKQITKIKTIGERYKQYIKSLLRNHLYRTLFKDISAIMFVSLPVVGL